MHFLHQEAWHGVPPSSRGARNEVRQLPVHYPRSPEMFLLHTKKGGTLFFSSAEGGGLGEEKEEKGQNPRRRGRVGGLLRKKKALTTIGTRLERKEYDEKSGRKDRFC